MYRGLIHTTLFSLAAAGGKCSEPQGHEYHPAGLEDSRSPCPGLNALANHGWLPHSGKELDYAAIQYATVNAYNFKDDVFDQAFGLVQSSQLSTTGNISTFNLEDLKKHNAIEFDGSLSRNDIFFGDNLHFNPAIWATVAEKLELYQPEKGKYVTIENAAKARAARWEDAMRVNPAFDPSGAEVGSPGTTALYLVTNWDDKANAAPKSWVKAFFEQERIAYKEGFKRQEVVKTNDILFQMVGAILAVKV